ncbi:MAG: DUF927 domain-containing protein [Peptostreptococcaceae bacterium]|nr:DUF927 domain-containing protein [Peptostreptococcaceae bacterium]
MALRKLQPTRLKRNGKFIDIDEQQLKTSYVTMEYKLPSKKVEVEEANNLQSESKLKEEVENASKQLGESNQNEINKITRISDELSISYKDNVIYYGEGNTARLITLHSIEKNIDKNHVKFKMTTDYMDEKIEMELPREDAVQRKGMLKLASQGANVNELNAKFHIMALEYQEKNITKVNKVHSEIGFSEYDGKEIFKLYKAINEDSTYKGNLDIKPKGTLEEYLKDVKKNVAPYASMSLALALGTSSAVVAKLNRLDVDINTLFTHIVAESSKGKSTATMLAISVWGNPKVGAGGLYNTWNATENALITSLSGNYGVAYALDELSMTKIENATSLIYNLVGGKDKVRLTKNIEMRESGTWITTLISNGEASILSKANSNTGIDMRVMELEGITWTQDAEHSEEVKRLATRNYGVFGHSFAERLIKFSSDKLVKLFKSERQNFINKIAEKGVTDNKIERTSYKYAVVLLTARLINSGYNEYGIKLDIDGIREILIRTEIESINKRGLEKKAEDWLLQQVEANASKFRSGNENNQNVDYWGTRKELSNGEIEIAILRDKFNEIMKRGKFEDPKVVLKQLKEEGKLDYENGRLTRKRKINAITTEVYVIRLKQ